MNQIDRELADLADQLQGFSPAPDGWDPVVWRERELLCRHRVQTFDYEAFRAPWRQHVEPHLNPSHS